MSGTLATTSINTSEFDEIYAKHYKEILSYCIMKIRCDKEICTDCVQEAFRILYERIASGEEILHPRAWLYRTADNMIKREISHIARQRNRIVCLNDNDSESYKYSVHQSYDNIISESRVDIPHTIESLLSSLSDDERNLYFLRYKRKLSVHDIANKIGISETAVTTRVSRLRTKLTRQASASLETQYL